jgi:hypothetical protein
MTTIARGNRRIGRPIRAGGVIDDAKFEVLKQKAMT